MKNLPTTNRYFIYNKDSQITSYYFKHKTQELFTAYKSLINQVEIIMTSKNPSIDSLNENLSEYIKILGHCSENYKFNFAYSIFDEINSKLVNFDKNIENFFKIASFENLFNLHIDLIYDRMSLISFDNLNLKINLNQYFQLNMKKLLLMQK